MNPAFTESVVEEAALAWARKAPAGTVLHGPDIALDAFRKLHALDAASLSERNRAVHRLLVDGVTVEYREADGAIAGAQARVLDFDARTTTTGWRSTSSRSSRTSTRAGRTWCCS